MSIRKELICRLCLKVMKNESKAIDGTMKLAFDILLLKLELNITRDPMVCQDCVDIVKKCLEFKYTCINTERVVLSSSVTTKKAKHDIKDICKDGEDIEAVVDEDFDICRFCMTRLVKSHFVSLDVLMNGSVFDLLSGYLLEMDFNTTENSMICTICKENIESYFHFVLNCLDTETKIKSYCKEEKNDHIHIKLDSVLHFLFKRMGKLQDIERLYPAEYRGLIKQEELDIKEEGTDKMYKCSACGYKSKRKGLLKRHIMMVHEDVSEVKKVTCSLCGFWTKQNSTLKTHMLIHKDNSEKIMFTCSLCAYKSHLKNNLTKHMLVHKDVSEIKMFTCSLCAFQSKYKCSLAKHMLVHKDVSEIQMFRCPWCAFESKHKSALEHHIIIHKDDSEKRMFTCSLCAYKTARKCYLTNHMLVHKDDSEKIMFPCSSCAYKSHRKSNLISHMLVHRDISETQMFTCSLCAFASKRKRSLAAHMLTHMDDSEKRMFTCSLCAYKSPRKSYVTKHMLVIHKDLSEIKCTQ